jgi:hypothetical protein
MEEYGKPVLVNFANAGVKGSFMRKSDFRLSLQVYFNKQIISILWTELV